MPKERGWKKKVIRISSEIRLVLKTGKKIQTKWYRLFYRPTETGHMRFAVIVGKRFGTAVHRNRAKRRFRELLRKGTASLSSGVDIILIPEPASLHEDVHTLQKAIDKTLTHHMDMMK